VTGWREQRSTDVATVARAAVDSTRIMLFVLAMAFLALVFVLSAMGTSSSRSTGGGA
jgi:hypothetical protein